MAMPGISVVGYPIIALGIRVIGIWVKVPKMLRYGKND